jgi:hypothetical protein
MTLAAIPPLCRKGIMDKRILELAVETLERRKAEIEAEIEIFQGQLGIKTPITIPTVVASTPKGRRSKTAAEREAHSERMKAYWAEKRGKSAKPKAAPKRAGKDANQSRSEKMKAYWAARRAQKAKK